MLARKKLIDEEHEEPTGDGGCGEPDEGDGGEIADKLRRAREGDSDLDADPGRPRRPA